MVALPAVAPAVTVPPALTVAKDVLVHAPPDVASLRALEAFIHALDVPLIGSGATFTVTVLSALHPNTEV